MHNLFNLACVAQSCQSTYLVLVLVMAVFYIVVFPHTLCICLGYLVRINKEYLVVIRTLFMHVSSERELIVCLC